MKKLLLLLSLFFCVALGYSQTNTQANICEKVKNTYQVVVDNARIKVALTSDVCNVVERERKAETINYYRYNDYITLKIYPTSQLASIKTELPYIIYKGQE
ncbi:MAG: hypothetical protein K0S33_44 [Bacteroidetes bacterium]|jgi:hypothetical protein|nr:hypothetical protein [Bacteroidota bacterium]